tara:strand:- start:666 stop:1058 length:393 start_codon:yes stop_codon:yes gene_type:complete
VGSGIGGGGRHLFGVGRLSAQRSDEGDGAAAAEDDDIVHKEAAQQPAAVAEATVEPHALLLCGGEALGGGRRLQAVGGRVVRRVACGEAREQSSAVVRVRQREEGRVDGKHLTREARRLPHVLGPLARSS